MFKTCLECKHIRLKNNRGNPLYYCPKLSKLRGEIFYLCLSIRPVICPLLKKNKNKMKGDY